MKYITVYWKEDWLLVSAAYAETNNLYDGYRIKTVAEFWKILAGTAPYSLAITKSKVEENPN